MTESTFFLRVDEDQNLYPNPIPTFYFPSLTAVLGL